MDVFQDWISRRAAARNRLFAGALAASMLAAAPFAADAENPAPQDKSDATAALKDLPKIRNEEEPSKPEAPQKENPPPKDKPDSSAKNDGGDKKTAPAPAPRDAGKTSASDPKKNAVTDEKNAEPDGFEDPKNPDKSVLVMRKFFSELFFFRMGKAADVLTEAEKDKDLELIQKRLEDLRKLISAADQGDNLLCEAVREHIGRITDVCGGKARVLGFSDQIITYRREAKDAPVRKAHFRELQIWEMDEMLSKKMDPSPRQTYLAFEALKKNQINEARSRLKAAGPSATTLLTGLKITAKDKKNVIESCKNEDRWAREKTKDADADLPGAGELEAGYLKSIGLRVKVKKEKLEGDDGSAEEIRLCAVFENNTKDLMSNVSSEIFLLGAPKGSKDVLFVARIFKDQFSIDAGRNFATQDKTQEFVRKSKAEDGDMTYAGHIAALRDRSGMLLRTSSSSKKIAELADRILARSEEEFVDEFGSKTDPPDGVKTPPRKQSP